MQKMLGLIIGLVELWLALFIVFFLHELGHLGKPRIKRYFPIPLMYSENAPSRIGGLVVNFLIILAVYHYNPDIFFFKLIGAVSFVHIIYYFILGSIIPEPRVPKRFWHLVVFDDVDNGYWYLFFAGAAFIAYYFGPYYLEIIKIFIGGLA
jgi:hypothetical protein